MTATIGQIRDALRAVLRQDIHTSFDLQGPTWHALIEEFDDHACEASCCALNAQSFHPDLSKVPPFAWAGGAS